MGTNLPNNKLGSFMLVWLNRLLTNEESVVEIQQVAMCAKGCGASGVDDFAQVGCHCTNPKGCSRDLHRALLRDCSVP